MPIASKQAADSTEQLRTWIAGRLVGHPVGKLPTNLEADLPAIAEAEGVASLLAAALREKTALRGSKEEHGVSSKTYNNLHAMELARAGRELRLVQEVVQMLQALLQEGLEFLLLKGEALAHSLYREPHLRTRSDVDLLFAGQDQVERAWRVFEKAGYLRKPTLQGRFVGFQFPCSRTLANGLEIQFDVHREVSDFTWFARRLPFAELQANRSTVEVQGLSVSCPDPIYALLHACLHRIGNKPFFTANRLIWLYDIHLLSEALREQWPTFTALARDKGLARVCLQSLVESDRYFHTGADISALEASARSEPVALSEAATRRELYLLDWWHNPGAANKLRQLREHLLPSGAYMRGKYGLENSTLLPYYYVRRIAYGVKRFGPR